MNSRWIIRGALTTVEPLHIGSGELLKDDGRVKRLEKGDETFAGVKACITDTRALPYLPGSALKGALLSRFRKSREIDEATIERVFGGAETGGGLIVFDARIESGKLASARDSLSHLYNDNAMFSDERLTLIEPGTAIDRVRGAAADKKLYFEEVVPPGVCFQVELVLERSTEEQAAMVAAALEPPLKLGAENHSGRGELRWERDSIARLGPDEIRNWLADASNGIDPGRWSDRCTDGLEILRPHLKKFIGLFTPIARPGLDIILKFDSPFLVNDPGRVHKKKTSDHRPRLDKDGRPFLPPRSFRGALRAQAERILRTLKHDCCGNGLGWECSAVKRVEDVEKLCPACQLFGASGWRSPLHISAFTSRDVSPSQLPIQEFVAIDRFTGGVSGEKKFDAERPDRVVLHGRIELELERLCTRSRGLLALLLRDLVEGDIQFGWGKGKGFGACEAKADWLNWLAGEDATGIAREADALTKLVSSWVEELRALPKFNRPMEVQADAWRLS